MSAYAPFLLPIFLLFGFMVAVALVGLAWWTSAPGYRRGSVLVVPLVGAVFIASTLLVLAPRESVALPGTLLRGGLVAGGIYGLAPIWTLPIAVVVTLAGVVAAHYAVAVLPRLGAWAWRRLRRGPTGAGAAAELTRIIVLVLVCGAVAGATAFTKASTAPSSGVVEVIASFELDGSPTSIVAVDVRTGYIAFGEGTIARYELDEGSSTFTTEQVADGLSYPRGLAVADDRLFVIDLGPLPCENPFPQCWFSEPSRELSVLQETAGSVLSYPIVDGGRLGEASVVLEDLPVVSTEHAPNSLELGADGALYLAVGNVDRMPLEPELLDRIDRPNAEMLGTIVRFTPDGRDISIFARGIRNMYELETDPDGRLFGVDNDGPALRGFRAEQLVELTEGADWGFPENGAARMASPSSPTTPIWTLHLSGSGGLAWVDDIDGESGVLVGGLGTIVHIGLSRDNAGVFVEDESAVSTAIDGLQGFVPSIEPVGDGRILAGVFAPFAGYRNQLLVLSPGA